MRTAGEWEEALAIASLTHNQDEINKTITQIQSELPLYKIKDKKRLGYKLSTSLLKCHDRPPLLNKTTDGLEKEDYSNWQFAMECSVPLMVTVAGDTPTGMLKDGDIGHINPLDTKDIKGFLSGKARTSMAHTTLMRTSLAPSSLYEHENVLNATEEITGAGTVVNVPMTNTVVDTSKVVFI